MATAMCVWRCSSVNGVVKIVGVERGSAKIEVENSRRYERQNSIENGITKGGSVLIGN